MRLMVIIVETLMKEAWVRAMAAKMVRSSVFPDWRKAGGGVDLAFVEMVGEGFVNR